MKIKLENLTKIYSQKKNSVPALENLSVDFESGDFVSVIGRSGSGKSTLLKVLNGSEKSTSGSVFYDGVDFSKLSSKKKRSFQKNISSVYQDFCLVEETSVLDNVLNAFLSEMSFFQVLFSKFSGRQKSDAEVALSKVGLSGKINEKVKNLSGGEKQRVCIAQVLCRKSEVVLADEPSSALDPATTQIVLELLKNLSAEGKIVIMNCHNPEIAIKYGTKILGLKSGKKIFFENSENVTEEKLKLLYE